MIIPERKAEGEARRVTMTAVAKRVDMGEQKVRPTDGERKRERERRYQTRLISALNSSSFTSLAIMAKAAHPATVF